MPRAPSLPDDVESLKKLLLAAHDKVANLSAQLRSREVLIENLKLQLAKLKRLKFGHSSEQLDAQIAQLELSLEDLEANAAAEASPARDGVAPIWYTIMTLSLILDCEPPPLRTSFHALTGLHRRAVSRECGRSASA